MSKVLDLWDRIVSAVIEALLSGSDGEVAVKIVGAFFAFMFALSALFQVIGMFLPPV